MLLKEKIQDYISKNKVYNLYKNTWISANVFSKIRNNIDWKIYKKKLDILYSFFEIEKDDFYFKNLEKWIIKEDNNDFWNVLKEKRVKKCITIFQLWNLSRLSLPTIHKLENWKTMPNSNTRKNIYKAMEFSNEEIIFWEKYFFEKMKKSNYEKVKNIKI